MIGSSMVQIITQQQLTALEGVGVTAVKATARTATSARTTATAFMRRNSVIQYHLLSN
jgi:hypothetical protein